VGERQEGKKATGDQAITATRVSLKKRQHMVTNNTVQQITSYGLQYISREDFTREEFISNFFLVTGFN